MCKCYDCGSNIEGHHTELCAFAEESDVRDLPAHPGTQWWTGIIPTELQRNVIATAAAA